jgi:hypothetical protein
MEKIAKLIENRRSIFASPLDLSLLYKRDLRFWKAKKLFDAGFTGRKQLAHLLISYEPNPDKKLSGYDYGTDYQKIPSQEYFYSSTE